METDMLEATNCQEGIELGLNLILDGDEDALLDMMNLLEIDDFDLVPKLIFQDIFSKKNNLEAVDNNVMAGSGIYTGQIRRSNS